MSPWFSVFITLANPQSRQFEVCGRRRYFFKRHFSFFFKAVLITWQWENSEGIDTGYKREPQMDGAVVFLGSRHAYQNADAHCGRFSHCGGCAIKACYPENKKHWALSEFDLYKMSLTAVGSSPDLQSQDSAQSCGRSESIPHFKAGM